MGQPMRESRAVAARSQCASVERSTASDRAREQRLLQLGIARGDLVDHRAGDGCWRPWAHVASAGLSTRTNDVNDVASPSALDRAGVDARQHRCAAPTRSAHLGVGTDRVRPGAAARPASRPAPSASSATSRSSTSRGASSCCSSLIGVPAPAPLALGRPAGSSTGARPRPPADSGAHLRCRVARRRRRSRCSSASRGSATGSSARWCPRRIATSATPGGVPRRRHDRRRPRTSGQSPRRPTSSSSPRARSPSAVDFRRIAWDLEGHHVQMAVVPSLSDISSGRMTMRPVGGLPARPRRAAAEPRGLTRPQARLRPRRRERSLLAARAARHARLRGPDQAPGRRPGALPPDPRRP